MRAPPCMCTVGSQAAAEREAAKQGTGVNGMLENAITLMAKTPLSKVPSPFMSLGCRPLTTSFFTASTSLPTPHPCMPFATHQLRAVISKYSPSALPPEPDNLAFAGDDRVRQGAAPPCLAWPCPACPPALSCPVPHHCPPPLDVSRHPLGAANSPARRLGGRVGGVGRLVEPHDGHPGGGARPGTPSSRALSSPYLAPI